MNTKVSQDLSSPKHADFCLKIRHLGGSEYMVSVEETSSSDDVPLPRPYPFSLPFTQAQINETIRKFYLEIARTSLALRVRSAEQPELGETTPEGFGRKLFDAVFAGDIKDYYHARLDRDRYLKVILDLPENLRRLPWELLYDSSKPGPIGFLSVGSATPILRRVEREEKRRMLCFPPLRVLLVSANPVSTIKLDLKKEAETVQSIFKRPGSCFGEVEVKWLEDPTVDDLYNELLGFDPHILHFMGHGEVDKLLFPNEEVSGTHSIRGDTLGIMVADQPSLRLVVLNACETAVGKVDADEEISNQTWTRLSIAEKLAEVGVPATIGMQFRISDKASRIFSRNLYLYLAQGYPIHRVVTRARIGIKLAFGDHDTREWATPVLYLQAKSGHVLSDLLKGITSPLPPPPPPSKPDDILLSLYFNQGVEAVKQEEWRKALTFFKTIQSHGQGFKAEEVKHLIDAVSQKRKEEEQKAREEAVWQAAYQVGKAHFDNGDWQPAIYIFQWMREKKQEFNRGKTKEFHEISRLWVEARERQGQLDNITEGGWLVGSLLAQARAYEQSEQWENAGILLEEVEKLQGDAFSAELATELRQIRVRSQLKDWYTSGQKHFRDENWADAVEHLGRVVALDEKYSDGKVADLLKQAQRQQQLDAWLKQGMALLKMGDWDKALQALQRVMDDKPRRVEARAGWLYAKGCREFDNGNWYDAVAAFEELRGVSDKYRPDSEQYYEDAKAQIWLTETLKTVKDYRGEQDWRKAVNLLQEVTQRFPDNLEAGELLAEAKLQLSLNESYEEALRLEQIDRLENAIEILQKIVKDHSNYRDGEARKRLRTIEAKKRLIDDYNRGIELMDSLQWDQAVTYLERVAKSEGAGLFSDVEKRLKQARQQQRLIDLYDQGKKALAEAQKYEDLTVYQYAIDAFSEIVDQQPDFRNARQLLATASSEHDLLKVFQRGLQARGAEDWDAALEAWRKLQDMQPDYRGVSKLLEEAKQQKKLRDLYLKATTHEKAGEWTSAIETYEEVLATTSSYGDVVERVKEAERQRKLAELWEQARDQQDRQQWKNLIDTYSSILSLDPTNYDAKHAKAEVIHQYNLAEAYRIGSDALKEGKLELAIEKLSWIVEENKRPNYHDSSQLLGQARQRKALADNYRLGQTAMAQREWETAEKHFDTIIEIDPSYRDAKQLRDQVRQQKRWARLYNRALERLQKEDYQQAAKLLDEIVKEKPDYEDAQACLKRAKEFRELAELYERASAMANAGQWHDAKRRFENLVARAGPDGYKDATKRLEEARGQFLESLYQEGLTAMGKEDWELAIDRFDKLWQYEPNYRAVVEKLKESLRQRAEEFQRIGRLDQAMKLHKRIMNL